MIFWLVYGPGVIPVKVGREFRDTLYKGSIRSLVGNFEIFICMIGVFVI
jgi:hypothetical protein